MDEGDSRQLEAHIDDCPSCRDALVTVLESGVAPEWLEICRQKVVQPSPGNTSSSTRVDETLNYAPNGKINELTSVENLTLVGSQRYRFDRLIGEGGMGVVWEGTDTVMRRRVALKCLKSTGNLKVLGPRLMQEAASLARLSHRNIVAVFEVFSEDTRPTLVMEFIDGPTLATWRSGRVVNERQAAALVEQLASAAQHAHDNGVVHRDLKPSNILLNLAKESGTETRDLYGMVPKLSDFGLARIMGDQHLTQTGEMLGTPAYMAPEQTFGLVKAIGPAADIYGLGAILYDLLTGTPPHLAQDPVTTISLVRDRDPVAPRLVRPELSKDLETICLKCLRKSPNDRYASAGDLAADLRAFLEGRVIAARPLGAMAMAARWCRRHKLLTTALSAAAVSTVALIVGSLQFGRTEHALREKADRALFVANEAEAKAKAEAKRADAMRALIKKNYDVSMNAVSTLVQLSGLSGEVIDLDELRSTALREGCNVYKSFVDSLPDPEQWSLTDALAVTRYLEFAQRQPTPTDVRPWLEKLATILDRLEDENANHPERFVARQKYSREMAIIAQRAGNNEDAARWWERAGHLQALVSEMDGSNPLKYYQLAQASMNAALYHSYCSRPDDAVRNAEKSVAAYRRILELGEQTDKHLANFVEKLYWQARFEREGGNKERSQAIQSEAQDRRRQLPPDSPYQTRLDQSKINILGQ